MKRLVVDTEKLKHNIDTIKTMTNSTIIAVLKGNGYGLDLLQYASYLTANSMNYFAVAELDEALILRNNGCNAKILLLSATCIEEQAKLIAENNIIPTIGSEKSAQVMNQVYADLGIVSDVHIKIDTGFGRFGFLSERISEYYDLFRSLDHLSITGTYSHLSFSFSKDIKAVKEQYDKFMKAVEGLMQNGINPGMLHIANSCAFLRYPELHLDAVRIGSAFLGRLPIENKYGLKKIGFMESHIIEIKELPAKHHIGYANTYRTREPKRVGIVPVGYKDGFGLEKSRDTFRFRDILRYLYSDLKLFRKKLYVTVNGKKVRILGKIGMYSIIVDLTGVEAQTGDTVSLEINPLMVDSSVKRIYV